MKSCTVCLEDKPLKDYYSVAKKKVDGEEYLYSFPYCKKCASKKALESNYDLELKKKGSREWKQKRENRESVINSLKKYRDSGKYREWQDNNKDKIQKYRDLREMHKKHEISTKEWVACKEYFDNTCAYCGTDIENHYITYGGSLKWTDFHKEHVDHNGANDLSNCVPACKTCNSKKYNFELSEWHSIGNPVFCEGREAKIKRWLMNDYKNFYEYYRVTTNR